MNTKCVHTEHCCIKHGCKYYDRDCPVVLGVKVQSYECEDCVSDKEDLVYLISQHPDLAAVVLSQYKEK